MRGIVIGGTHSGCGKTTVTLGLLAALKKKGLKVQPFKVGPDFIDTGLHGLITDRASRNLDIWMCGKDYITECFHKHTDKIDIAIVEGVMGLFDGGDASTSEVAKILGIPVVLVVDASSMAESAAAVVKGFESFDPETKIAGVIFNKVAGERHVQMLLDAIKSITNTRMLGYLPKDIDFQIPHRHLGLTVAEEKPISSVQIEKLAEMLLQYVDVEKIMEYGIWNMEKEKWSSEISSIFHFPSSIRIAIAYDKAFCFYYEDNLDLLRKAGAQIVHFSPLSDSCIPEGVDAIYIGGGYPELYADALSKNKSMLEAIYTWSLSGKLLYAECGGLMYLSQGIWKVEDGGWKRWKMAGIFPFETQMKNNRANLGYREIQLKKDCILGKKGSVLRGHEFHYSEIKDGIQKIENKDQYCLAYSVKDKSGRYIYDEGYKFKNTLASYVHIHFGSNLDIARNLARFCMEA